MKYFRFARFQRPALELVDQRYIRKALKHSENDIYTKLRLNTVCYKSSGGEKPTLVSLKVAMNVLQGKNR